jgi:hypothetical protein
LDGSINAVARDRAAGRGIDEAPGTAFTATSGSSAFETVRVQVVAWMIDAILVGKRRRWKTSGLSVSAASCGMSHVAFREQISRRLAAATLYPAKGCVHDTLGVHVQAGV